MRIQAHVSDKLGETISEAAKARGVSLNNEVRLRLGLSLRDTAEELEELVNSVAKSMAALAGSPVWTVFKVRARMALSLVPVADQPTREPIGSEGDL